MVNEILGTNIRQNRLNLNWTQEKLAEKLCVSHQVVSKWENGIATPDIATLCTMAGIFGMSLDALCGVDENQTDSLVEELERMTGNPENTYEVLYAKWETVESRVLLNPADDRLLFGALQYLRAAHDRVMSDAQKEQVNEKIRQISERILDFSRNDSYRSYANYNLAVYYSERVNMFRGNTEDLANAQKAKYHGEMVLYRDMNKTFYRSLGVTSLEEDIAAMEKTLEEMTSAAMGACKNLLRRYRHFSPGKEKNKTCEDVYQLLLEVERKLSDGFLLA